MSALSTANQASFKGEYLTECVRGASRHGYLVTSMGKVVLSFGFVLSCLHLCGFTYLGPRRAISAKGHFKDYEVGANCIALLIVLCLWEGGVSIQFLWPKRLLS